MARTRRPMVTIEGTIADLRENDYVDTIGGEGFKKFQVGALVHRITEATRGDRSQPGATWAENGFDVDFLAKGSFGLKSQCPVTFRRFAD